MRCGERSDPAHNQCAGFGHGGHQRREDQQPGGSQVRMSLYLLNSFFWLRQELRKSLCLQSEQSIFIFLGQRALRELSECTKIAISALKSELYSQSLK